MPALPIILAGAALVKSVIDMQGADAQRRAARDAMRQIEYSDPSVTAQLANIREQTNYAESGMTRSMALKRVLINDSAQQTAANISRNAGGSGGTIMDSLLRNAGIQQRSLASAAVDTERLAPQYLSLETPLVMDQSYRKLSLQQHAADSEMAQATMNQRDANSNFYNSLAALSGIQIGGTGEPGMSDSALPEVPKQSNGPI